MLLRHKFNFEYISNTLPGPLSSLLSPLSSLLSPLSSLLSLSSLIFLCGERKPQCSVTCD